MLPGMLSPLEAASKLGLTLVCPAIPFVRQSLPSPIIGTLMRSLIKGWGMSVIDRRAGFTIIELMISIAVLSILLVIAIPSFNEFRQRAALRGAADQVATFWGDARFEALRRNQLVKAGVKVDGDKFCLGAATTTSSTDNTPCDCFSTTSNVCNVGTYGVNQAEWKNVSLAETPPFGQATGIAVINPKRGDIVDPADAGKIRLKGPPGNFDYRLDINIDRLGRAILCEPSAAPAKLSQYTDRRC